VLRAGSSALPSCGKHAKSCGNVNVVGMCGNTNHGEYHGISKQPAIVPLEESNIPTLGNGVTESCVGQQNRCNLPSINRRIQTVTGSVSGKEGAFCAPREAIVSFARPLQTSYP